MFIYIVCDYSFTLGLNNAFRSFKGDLDAIWKRFEEYSSQGTKELISVKHLAYLLKNISGIVWYLEYDHPSFL